MIAAVHAVTGAASGSILKQPLAAFVVGVCSHMVLDMIPHRDLPANVALPIALAALTFFLLRFGWKSAEFVGSIGAVCPDFESVAVNLRILSPEHEFFPTHFHHGVLHGSLTPWYWSQIAVTFLAVITIAIANWKHHAKPSG